MSYINKDAIVTEIERRIERCAKQREDMLNVQCHTLADDASARMGELSCFKDFLNTLEVKEVDLEKEVRDYIEDNFTSVEKPDEFLTTLMQLDDMVSFAKHFFELGIRVNNPITAADRGMVEEIIINLKRIEQDYHINLTREMEWLRNKVKKGE